MPKLDAVKKQEIIDHLVGNCECGDGTSFSQDDVEVLNKFSLEQLEKLVDEKKNEDDGRLEHHFNGMLGIGRPHSTVTRSMMDRMNLAIEEWMVQHSMNEIPVGIVDEEHHTQADEKPAPAMGINLKVKLGPTKVNENRRDGRHAGEDRDCNKRVAHLL